MLLTFSDQLIKYGMWPVSVLIFCLIVVILFRERIGPIFDKIGPAIDRLKKAGPVELTSAPPNQQPINVPTKSEKIFIPWTICYLRSARRRFVETSRRYFRVT